jgi:NAD-dependent deacetylase
MLPEKEIGAAFDAASRAELFFSCGTSALVHPAASMPMTARRNGAYLVEINLEPTPLTEFANFSIQGKSGEILPEIVRILKG